MGKRGLEQLPRRRQVSLVETQPERPCHLPEPPPTCLPASKMRLSDECVKGVSGRLGLDTRQEAAELFSERLFQSWPIHTLWSREATPFAPHVSRGARRD